MKKYLSVLTLLFLSFALHAQSVWTGNAAVGGPVDFPGISEVFRASSNSFPSGTVLQITNPSGGAMVLVTVTGRLESPGVFILIEEAAAKFIGLPTDHVLPVRVTPVVSTVIKNPSELITDDGKLTEDTDYNPAASLDDKQLTVTTVITPETETIEIYDLVENDSVDSGTQIYFLTPSDLRPPPEDDDENEIIPAVNTGRTADIILIRYLPGDSRKYIQIGAYNSITVLENTAQDLGRVAPGYPLSVAAVDNENGTVFKLLIGPLTPAEVGIVLQTARDTRFPGAFPYSP